MPRAAMTGKEVDATDLVSLPLVPDGATKGLTPAAAESPPVILSKVQIPRQRPVTLGRARLLGWLDQHASDRVVVVSAEVGYGKSTLLADYARRSGIRCVWYRVEDSDGDWISFLGHMIAAIRVVHPGFGSSSEALLRHVAAVGPPRDVVTSSLLAEMGTLPPERTLVVLDDFHLVAESEDVRSILRRTFESAPEDWRFVIGTRGRASLPIGRLAGQGAVAELTTHELRFSRAEIEELFDLHHHQLTSESLEIVYERTQGWAASLNLILASLATSRPSELDRFIGALSGARGPIHDLLAQEVLARLDRTTERVLVHASLLDRVTPTLVAAAMSETSEPVDVATATLCLVEAEALGLLVTADDSIAGSRFHPLLRDFLRHHLSRSATPERIAAMHVAIARTAEGDDWLAAGGHYARGGAPEEAMRVLDAAAYTALGTGAWGAASAVVASTPGVVPPPAVEVVRARALISEGRAEEALAVLDGLENEPLSRPEKAILGLTRANGLYVQGRHEEMAQHLDLVVSDGETPELVRRVAMSWLQMVEANRGGSLSSAYLSLRVLARDVAREGLYYFAGVALHNAAGALLAMGRYDEARTTAREALAILENVNAVVAFAPSTQMIVAQADFESGHFDRALGLARELIETPSITPDALAEASYIACLLGKRELAESLLDRFSAQAVPSATEASASFQAVVGRLSLAIARHQMNEAGRLLRRAEELAGAEMDGRSRVALAKALVESEAEEASALASARAATYSAERQGAWRWGIRARIAEASAAGDRQGVSALCEEAGTRTPGALLETASVVAKVLDVFDESPAWLRESVLAAPGHWLPLLRRRAGLTSARPSLVAASLIAEFGSVEDTPVLREFEQRFGLNRRRRGLVAQLARKVSPTVRVHDLGRVTCDIGHRTIELSEARRRAASLLLYMVTRPSQAAARDQVMDDLFPDQAPQSALNSLHQTIFFLRRLLEPWQEEGLTSPYVRMEAEIVLLTPELFQIDSAAFHRQATAILADGQCATRGPAMLRLYKGTFAPEFEYEPWAEDWRSLVHSSFLRLADFTTRELVDLGNLDEALDLLNSATSLDPSALELRGRVVQVTHWMGAKDAATAQYRRLVAAYERELGEPAPSYETLVRKSNRE